MKQGIILAGAVALAFAGAASAKPPHAQHGGSHPGKGKGQQVRVLDQHQGHVGYGTGGCPPGLQKKPQCMPPGQYKKQFEVGQRLPLGYKGLLGLDALPYQMRSQYGSRLDPNSRYAYDDNYLYRVDPKTMIVNEVLRGMMYR